MALPFSRILFPALIGLLACKPQTLQRPADVLPPDKMIAMQAGVHRIEAEISIRRMDFPVAQPLFRKRLDSLARLHKTDTATYRRSFTWYAEHIDQMDLVYSAVIDTLSLQESRLSGRKDTARK